MTHTFKIKLSDEDYWVLCEKTTGAEAVRDEIQDIVEKAIEDRRKRTSVEHIQPR